MMILFAKTPAKEGVAKIAARFARHFYPSTPLFLKSWIRPCLPILKSLDKQAVVLEICFFGSTSCLPSIAAEAAIALAPVFFCSLIQYGEYA